MSKMNQEYMNGPMGFLDVAKTIKCGWNLGSAAVSESNDNADWEIVTSRDDWQKFKEIILKGDSHDSHLANFVNSNRPRYLIVSANEGEPGTCIDGGILRRLEAYTRTNWSKAVSPPGAYGWQRRGSVQGEFVREVHRGVASHKLSTKDQCQSNCGSDSES
ncbi:hypothetical protein M378DRAFT_28276 [Amanita muscaria Koide BX008]|uniref:Uncharacterized protein n=1 Tax=Amanita muscaria (strain Koide BX008) TaxID=946122 RepID=A0A0C2SRG0_AMAMK|nr:hypothetical protein M378DRAFT_28276 [Amanita muscaria Koide BX008]